MAAQFHNCKALYDFPCISDKDAQWLYFNLNLNLIYWSNSCFVLKFVQTIILLEMFMLSKIASLCPLKIVSMKVFNL